MGNSCWNGTTSFENFVETEISCCAPRFPLILTAKLHSLHVKESKLGIGNFGKVGVGYFVSDSAALFKNLASPCWERHIFFFGSETALTQLCDWLWVNGLQPTFALEQGLQTTTRGPNPAHETISFGPQRHFINTNEKITYLRKLH